MSPEIVYVVNIVITATAFGFWKDSFAAALFMASSIFGISIFVSVIFGGR